MTADAVRQARRMHREALEAVYDGVCTVYEKQPVFDPVTKVTAVREVEVLSEEP